MRKKASSTMLAKKIILLSITIATIINYLHGNAFNIGLAAPKMSLYIKKIQYVRTNQTNKVKKTQVIKLKNLSSKHKVAWKSNNKRLASVKAKKNEKAVLTVSLGKAGTAKITASVRDKKTNKKVKTFTKKIKVVNKKTDPAPSPTAKPDDKKTAAPVDNSTAKPTEAPTAVPTDKPTGTPSITPTASSGDNLVTLPPITQKPTDNPTTTPTTTPTPTATPTKNPNDEGWTGWY